MRLVPRRSHVVAATVLTVVASAGTVVAFAQDGGSGPRSFAFVARGDNPVDALAAAPVAGRLDAPVFLTRSGELSEETRAGIAELLPDVIIVAGGTTAVSDAVLASLQAAAPDAEVRRVDGASRYATAANIAALLREYDPAFLPGGSDLTGLATLQDLTGLLSADDLAPYATIDDLAALASADDLAGVASVEDLEGLATVEQLQGYQPVDAPYEARVALLAHSGTPAAISCAGDTYCAANAWPVLLDAAGHPGASFRLEAVLDRATPGQQLCVRLYDHAAATAISDSEVCESQSTVAPKRSAVAFDLNPGTSQYSVQYRVTGGTDATVHAVALVATR